MKCNAAVGLFTKPSTFIAVLISFLIFIQFDLTFGSKGFEVRNCKVGSNVFVPADKTISGGLLAAGANVEVSGNVKGKLMAFGGNVVLASNFQGELTFSGANVVLSGKYHKKVKGV